jgi:two-component system cell cycle sensor histidine kinase/response regulator CckA
MLPVTILVVDGNWMFREAVALALAKEGFRVLQATTPKEALAFMELQGEHVNLVMNEVNFRGAMQGMELLEALRKINRGVKAVFVSGYVDDAVEIHKAGDVHVLKPCQQRELMGKVKERLEAR